MHCTNRYKITYGFDDVTGDAIIECVVEVTDVDGIPLLNPITYRPGEPGFNNLFNNVFKTSSQCTIDTDIRIRCMCDDINGDGTTIIPYYEATKIVITDTITSTPLGAYSDYALSVAYTPINPTVCDDIGVDSLSIERVCLVDNVNGDGSNLVPFIRFVSVNMDGTVSTIAEVNSTLTGSYTSTLGLDPNSIGVDADGKTGRVIVENGATWSPTELIKSYTVRVEGVSNNSGITDSFGNATTFIDNEVSSWSFDCLLSDSTPVVTAGAGAKLVITYTSI